MKILLFSSFIVPFCLSIDINPYDKLEEIYINQANAFWTEQFKPFEKSGFTNEMIQGAKGTYHGGNGPKSFI